MNSEIDYPAEYDNSGRVANAAELMDQYITDATKYREFAADRAQIDLEYGGGDRNKMDIFWPDSDAARERDSPMVMFIHGGYWQRMDKSCFSHMAAGLNDHGIAVAIPSYTLCPQISVEGIINEMRRACLVLFQTFQRRITVVGHSAGGHLTACMLGTNWPKIHQDLPHDLVASGLGISGLYDLVPILQTPINDALGMDDEQARSTSPMLWLPETFQRFDAWVGSEESNEFHRQSRQLAQRWNMLATPCRYVSVPGANHFTVIDGMVKPDSPMVRRIIELMEKPAAEIELPQPDEKDVEKLSQQFTEESMAEGPDPEPDPLAETQSDSSGDGDGAQDDEVEFDADAILVETSQDSGESDESDGDGDGENNEDDVAAFDLDELQLAEEMAKSVNLTMPPEAMVEPELPDAPDLEGSAEQQPEQPAGGDQTDTTPQKKTE
ncbi:MAG: alpha/beta hydrolase fold domain-containing protein [Rhizobiaceae bacterium]